MSTKHTRYGRTAIISVDEFVQRLKAGEKLQLVVYKRRKLVELVFPQGPSNLSNHRIPSSKTASLYVHGLVIRSFVDGKFLYAQTKVEVMHGKPYFQIYNDGQDQMDNWQENPTAALRAYYTTVSKDWNRSNNGKLHLPIQEPVIQAILKEYYKYELEALDLYSQLNTWDIKEVQIRRYGSSKRRRSGNKVETEDDTADSLTNTDSDDVEDVVPKTPKITNQRKRRTVMDDDGWSDESLSLPIQPHRCQKRARLQSNAVSRKKLLGSFRNLPEPLEESPAQSGLTRFAGEISLEEPTYDADCFSFSHNDFLAFADPSAIDV